MSAVSTASNRIVATVGTASLPYSVAVSSDGTKAFVANEYGLSLSVIATSSNSVESTISRVGVYPVGVATH